MKVYIVYEEDLMGGVSCFKTIHSVYSYFSEAIKAATKLNELYKDSKRRFEIEEQEVKGWQ